MIKTLTYLHKKSLPRSKYRILGLVGQGQYGRVFCAIHRQSGNLVALKELERQGLSTQKFLRELRFLLSLQHPNIVTCQALEYTQNRRYLVMDYCEGGTLRNLIQSKSQLSLVDRLKLIADVLAALQHAHDRNIVHRDIKPENILLRLDSTCWIASISDFGVACLSEDVGSSSVGNTGSPAYMAPERFYGKYSPASDIYAVGVMLFELAVGSRPFSGSSGEIMLAHLNQSVKVPNTVPFLLRSTISKALEKLPARRFTCASQMLKSLLLAIDVESAAPSQKKPAVALSVSPSFNTQQKLLQAPVTSLAVAAARVYQANASEICCQTYASDILSGDILYQWQLPLPAPVQALIVRPQGCFTVTKFSSHNCFIYSVYCLPRSVDVNQSECCLERYKLGTIECLGLATAIDTQGRWMAIAKTVREPGLLENQTVFQILKLPNLEAVKPPVSCRKPSQILALDSRYGIVISTQQGDEGDCTVLEIFNRRGSFIGSLKLPRSLRLVTRSANLPYQLVAIEEKNPNTALAIDLKPFKVVEIKLDIAAQFIAATGWGYIMADKLGNIVLFDLQVQRIAAFTVSAPITAIAAFADYGLAIATESGDWGTLYKVDLKNYVTVRDGKFADGV